MIKLQQEGYNPMFAYEEAIGFMNGTEIRDKDGVSLERLFPISLYLERVLILFPV